MANLVLLGVYTSKAALDAAELTPSNGDCYLVGSKCPYDVYKYVTADTAFKKQTEQVGRLTDFDITIDDVTEDIPVSKLYTTPFKADDGKTLKVRKGLHLGEIHLYVPGA